jgi:DNA-binding SARP family transcriptional activator
VDAVPDAPHFQLCGRLAVRVEGERVEERVPGRRGRLALGYLVRHRHRPVTRDELVEAVWFDEPPDDAGAVLRPLLSRLRGALGADTLPGGSELRLSLPAGAFIDVEAADSAVHDAEALAARGDLHAAYGPGHVAQYIGARPLLAGIEAPWLAEWRAQHEDVYLRSLECCAEIELGIGGMELVAGERAARKLMALAPFRETGHRLVLELLAARGEHAEALRVFDAYRCLLRDELGTAPAARIAAVHERLLNLH